MEDVVDPNLEPVAENDKGKIITPRERLTSAAKLRSIHRKFCDDDAKSERNRAKIQDLKDYKPPLRAELLRRAGQKGRFNVNFGECGSLLNESSSNYIDAFESPEHLVPIALKRNIYDDVEKEMYERIMSDEYTRMVRGWDSSYFVYLTMVDQFITQGIAIGYFSDRHTWQFNGAGLREFKFPRKTKAHSDNIEICTHEGQYGRARLADIIQDEDVARSAGWDINEVKRVLAGGSDALYDEESAEDRQEKAKANDLDEQSGEFAPINVVHAWVKEYDGTVSYYITTKFEKPDQETQREPDSFLYKKKKAYKNFGEALQLFPFHVGNKGNLYTIRGLGYMIYAIGMASNTMQCALLDSAKDSMSVKYIAPSEREIGSMPIVNAGPATFIPPHLQIVDKQYQPDLTRSAMPAVEFLKRQMDARSASSTVSSVFQNKQDRRSAMEVSAALEHFNSLNSAAMLLWSHPWRALLSQSATRAFNPVQDETQESGRLALQMQQACIERGVPKEAFEHIDLHATKTAIPVAAGGKAARGSEFEAGASLYTAMDDVGRQNFNRDRAIHHFGVERAKRYLNFEDIPRELHDQRIAVLETNDLIEGQWIEPSNAEVHIVHLRVHIGKLEEFIQYVEEGEMELVEVTQQMKMLFDHVVATMQLAVVPEMQEEELEMFEQKVQQIGEYINNGIRQLQKLQREQEEAAAQQPEGEGEGDASNREAELKLQLKQAEAELSIQKKQFENQIDAEKKMNELKYTEMLAQQKMVLAEQEALNKQKIANLEASSKMARDKA